jgi:hypothetical protein
MNLKELIQFSARLFAVVAGVVLWLVLVPLMDLRASAVDTPEAASDGRSGELRPIPVTEV